MKPMAADFCSKFLGIMQSSSADGLRIIVTADKVLIKQGSWDEEVTKLEIDIPSFLKLTVPEILKQAGIPLDERA